MSTAIRLRHATLLLLATALTAVASSQAQISTTDELRLAFLDGGEYTILPGDYPIPEPVVVTQSLRLVGSDHSETFIDLGGNPVALQITGDIDVHFEQLTMIYAAESDADLIVAEGARLSFVFVDLGFAQSGNTAEVPPGRVTRRGVGLALTDGASAVGDQLRFAANDTAAIEMTDGTSLLLRDSLLNANFSGIIGRGAFRIEIHDSMLAGQFGQAIAIEGTGAGFELEVNNSEFDNNGMADPARNAFFPTVQLQGAGAATFNGGIMSNSPHNALSITDTVIASLTGVRITGNGTDLEEEELNWPALHVEGEAMLGVSGSVLIGNPGGAFSVAGNGTLAVSDSHVAFNSTWAHTYVEDSGCIGIVDSVITGNAGSIFVGGNGRLLLQGTEVTDNQADGVVVAGEVGAEISGNLVARNDGSGIWVAVSAHADVTGNVITANDMGVWVSHAATAMLVGNDIVENRHTGVAAVGTSMVMAQENRIDGNAFNGAAVVEDARALFEDGRFVGNGQNGLLFSSPNTSFIERNLIAGSPVGVRLERDAQVQGSDNEFADNGENVSQEQ